MSLLTEASLVITPNAVKEGKLFSIIPTDGSGDLTVVRATTATRVNSDGLIEEVPYNLLQRSEELNVSPWINIAVTTNASAVLSPSNSNSYKIIPNTTNTNHYILQNISVVSGTTYTFSFFAKADGYNFTSTFISALGIVANWDLQNGTASAGASIVNYGNGWYRCIVSGTAVTTGASSIRIYAQETSISAFSGNGVDGVLAWGAQLVTGSSAKEYFPTTDRLNVPRLDYTNSSCPSILVEPQRTNLLLRSEEFDNLTVWPGSAGVTRLANQGIAPNGTNTMDLITFPISGNSISQSVTVINGTTYTFSVWLASQSGTQTVEIGNINSGIYQSVTVTTTPQRFEVTQVASSTNRFPAIRATAAYSIFAWGAQLEAGSSATSYIPTVASTVTRNADVISKTGIADLIGQTEGTIFVDLYSPFDGTSKEISLSDGTLSNRISIGFLNQVNRFTIQVIKNNITQVSNTFVSVNQNIRNKIVLSYEQNNYKLYINGVLSYSDTLAETFTNELLNLQLNRGISQNQYFGEINSVALWKTALTDQECINLTTI